MLPTTKLIDVRCSNSLRHYSLRPFLQDHVPKDDLLNALLLEFVNRVNEVGVDVNRCINQPHTAGLIQFVCGLGPRKGFHLLKASLFSRQPLEAWIREKRNSFCHLLFYLAPTDAEAEQQTESTWKQNAVGNGLQDGSKGLHQLRWFHQNRHQRSGERQVGILHCSLSWCMTVVLHRWWYMSSLAEVC